MFSRLAHGALLIPRNSRLASNLSLKETLNEIIPVKRAQLQRLKTEHSQAHIGEIKVENIIGGMRGLKAMLWEASVLDPNEGIRFHGLSITDCKKQLPAAKGGKEIILESMLWLLLTGRVPTEQQTRELSCQLAERGGLPQYAEKIIDSLPKSLHPMTQLAIGVSALNHDSKFVAAYEQGIPKADYWSHALEDSLDLIAKLPTLAARIYSNVYRDGAALPAINRDADVVGNYVNMLGYGDNHSLTEYLRLYVALHGDHEGGNVSAHTAHLVGSALSDPYLSYSAALQGLAGPLHGLANQEVLRWMLAMEAAIGPEGTHDQIKEYIWRTLRSGQVVPGYGHGVLRSPDPRYIALQEFVDTEPELQKSPIVQLVRKTFEVAPGVLLEHGKTKNPYPNVDATSGCLLYHYGLTEFKYYTVIFGVSRAIGALTQYVWDRALGLPLERPKSVSLDVLESLIKK